MVLKIMLNSFCKRNVGKGYWIYFINQNFSFATSAFQLQISNGFKTNVELFLKNKCRQSILNLFCRSFKRNAKGDLKSCSAHLSKEKKIDFPTALRRIHVVMSKSQVYIILNHWHGRKKYKATASCAYL